jgi:two-component system phosphate regulon response regulator OmpR
VLDLTSRSLEKNKKPVHLTTREYELLRVLVSHPNQPMDRQSLAMKAMGRPLAENDRSLDVQVARLRKLIEQQPDAPRYLQTVWGSGYVFTPGR